MAGFLRGWLKGETHAVPATWANACGAFAVSRLLCAPEYPTWPEMTFFLEHGSKEHALRKDEALNHLHWATTRRGAIPQLMALAIDHRTQLEDLPGATPEKIGAFKRLAVKAADAWRGRPATACCSTTAMAAMRCSMRARDGQSVDRQAHRAAGQPAAPLRVQPGPGQPARSTGGRMVDHCIKVPMCSSITIDDDPALNWPEPADRQAAPGVRRLRRTESRPRAANRDHRRQERRSGRRRAMSTAILTELYDAHLRSMKPDWWKLEPQAGPCAAHWRPIDRPWYRSATIRYCRGVVAARPRGVRRKGAGAGLCGGAATPRTVKGWRSAASIFAEAARGWLAGHLTDEQAIADMARRFESLTSIWQRLGTGHRGRRA